MKHVNEREGGAGIPTPPPSRLAAPKVSAAARSLSYTGILP